MAPFNEPLASDASPQMNRTRLVESVIIAGATGILGVLGNYFWTVPTLTEKLQAVSAEVAEIKRDLSSTRGVNASTQADLARVQERLAGVQSQMVEVQRATNRRLDLIEQRVFKLQGRDP